VTVAGWLDDHTGIVSIPSDFVKRRFGAETLTKVKPLVLIASEGNSIVMQFLSAGASSVIFCKGVISLQLGLMGVLTVQLVSHLTHGEDVESAVYDTISPFNQGQQSQDPLDTSYSPPFWYIGNGTLTIP